MNNISKYQPTKANSPKKSSKKGNFGIIQITHTIITITFIGSTIFFALKQKEPTSLPGPSIETPTSDDQRAATKHLELPLNNLPLSMKYAQEAFEEIGQNKDVVYANLAVAYEGVIQERKIATNDQDPSKTRKITILRKDNDLQTFWFTKEEVEKILITFYGEDQSGDYQFEKLQKGMSIRLHVEYNLSRNISKFHSILEIKPAPLKQEPRIQEGQPTTPAAQ